MQKLRIAVWHNLPSGGGKRQLYNHVKGLLERGHYLESWCPDSADQNFLPLSDLIKENIVPLRTRSDEFRNPLRPYKVTRELIETMEDHCKSCAAEISRSDFDLLYANSCLYLRTTPIGKYVGLPSAIYLGEPYRWFYEAMPELPWIAPKQQLEHGVDLSNLKEMVGKYLALNTMRLQARAELEYAKAFDCILANSVYSRESILRAYNLDSKVCYLGIDTDFYQPTGETREDFVVGLGTFYGGKGVDRAIHAVGAIDAAKRPKLVWIGNGGSESELAMYRELAARLKVDLLPKVNISDQEVISLLSRARVMLYTSRLEPFGLAPLEANACCTPVVGIAEGGVKETIRDGVNGYLALDDDAQALAGLITKLLDDPAAAAEMGSNARRYVKEKWPYDFGTDNIERALLSLVQRKGMGILRGTFLNDLEPTDDIRMNVEEKHFADQQLKIKGWGTISDDKGSRNSSIFLLVQDGEKRRVLPMKPMKRYDVTKHFGGSVDYDDSGFFLECAIEEKEPKFGIVIIREEKVSFRLL